MKYLANSADPGLGMSWTAESFDDAAWAAGNYGVGFELSPEGAQGLIHTEVPVGTSSIWTRARFFIPNASILQRVVLGADYDDAIVAWIKRSGSLSLSGSGSRPAELGHTRPFRTSRVTENPR